MTQGPGTGAGATGFAAGRTPPRSAGPRVPRLFAAAMVLLALAASLALLAGCNRRPRFVPASADSTRAGAGDSLRLLARQVQERWDSPGAGVEAAELTARLVGADLAAHPRIPWAERTRAFLDSLGLGAEVVGGRGALAVNFFARSDPTAGSWPHLFWHGPAGPRQQALEGRDLHLLGLSARGLEGGKATAPGVAVLFGRRAANGEEPLLMVWGMPQGGSRFELAQTLGPDSLGGTGTGEFQSPADTVVELVTRTFRASPRFEECATCPHLYRTRRFRWAPAGFGRVADQVAPSPYSTFVLFIQALSAGDRDAAMRLVSDRALLGLAQRYEWGQPRGLWRAAPASTETAGEMVFFRGAQEAYRVRFELRDGDWRISGFEPTTRTIE